jgi:hypothetical protein
MMNPQSTMMDDNDKRVQDFDDPNVARYIQDGFGSESEGRHQSLAFMKEPPNQK